jgi:ABC-type multidrug transport system fused ATPase/permease subunit
VQTRAGLGLGYGELNGQIEKTYTGHALVKVFGRQREVGERSLQKNVELCEASCADHAGQIMPAMTFIGNLLYVGTAVVGGLQVASGAMQLGDVQAFIQHPRQFSGGPIPISYWFPLEGLRQVHSIWSSLFPPRFYC